jgi:hypothetical protein
VTEARQFRVLFRRAGPQARGQLVLGLDSSGAIELVGHAAEAGQCAGDGATWGSLGHAIMGHGDKGHRRTAALAALLTEATVEAAAAKAGIGYRTLKKWLAEEGFRRRFRELQREVLERTVARLVSLGGKAVDALAKNLDAPSAAASNRAAELVLSQTAKGLELLDFDERLKAIEERLGVGKQP